MVEILKPGVLYEQRYLQVECRRCLSLLKFRGDEPVQGVDIAWIVCPLCGTEINVAGAIPAPAPA